MLILIIFIKGVLILTTSKRDYRFDLLRLILILMVAVYHMLSYYGSNYVDIQQGGFRSFLVQNFLWAGGRMACNVFLFISAWFLVDKKSNRKKILDIWITVLTYSIIIGIFFFIKTKDIFSLIRHFIPILSNQVWYVTSYISILFVVPLLNTILEHCDLMQQKKGHAGYFHILFHRPFLLCFQCSLFLKFFWMVLPVLLANRHYKKRKNHTAMVCYSTNFCIGAIVHATLIQLL